MIRVYNYCCANPECSNDSKVEAFLKELPPDIHPELKCVDCMSALHKTSHTTRSRLEGITGDFPSAADQWANKHEEAARVANRRNRDRNVYETEQGER